MPWRPWLGVVLWLCVGPALAQFDKSPWPAKTPSPALDALDLQGQRWTSSDLLGKVVVLNFWATWCGPCKEELPTLQTLHDLGDSRVVVLSVNVREPAPRAMRYAQATGLTFPVLPDPKGDLAKRWGVTVYPSTLLLAPDGQARWRVVGDVDWSGREAQGWLTQLAHIPVRTSPGPSAVPSLAPKR